MKITPTSLLVTSGFCASTAFLGALTIKAVNKFAIIAFGFNTFAVLGASIASIYSVFYSAHNENFLYNMRNHVFYSFVGMGVKVVHVIVQNILFALTAFLPDYMRRSAVRL
ncbi:MAG: hypothetical protein AAGI90_01635 [Chlamydiota bacterium]